LITTIAFYTFATVLLLSGLSVVLVRNPVHSVLFLILSFFNAAALFILLGAEFLAMILVIVYVGAVAVLFLFVVMMLDVDIQQTIKLNLFGGGGFLRALLTLLAFLISFTGLFIFSLMALMSLMSFAGLIEVDFAHMNLMKLIFDTGGDSSLSLFELLRNTFLKNLWSLQALLLGASLGISYILSHFVTIILCRDTLYAILLRCYHSLPLPLFILAVFLGEIIILIKTWTTAETARELLTAPMADSTMSNTHALGMMIYTDYMLIFQISGIILLVAMIGAIVLTHRERPGVKRQKVSDQLARTKENSLELKKIPLGGET